MQVHTSIVFFSTQLNKPCLDRFYQIYVIFSTCKLSSDGFHWVFCFIQPIKNTIIPPTRNITSPFSSLISDKYMIGICVIPLETNITDMSFSLLCCQVLTTIRAFFHIILRSFFHLLSSRSFSSRMVIRLVKSSCIILRFRYSSGSTLLSLRALHGLKEAGNGGVNPYTHNQMRLLDNLRNGRKYQQRRRRTQAFPVNKIYYYFVSTRRIVSPRNVR